MKSAGLMCGLGAVIALLTGCGGDDLCRTDGYPAAPDDATSVLHVSAGCSADDADGSATRPYPTIGEAVGRASAGTAVVIAPGTYAEDVAITQSISLIGASATASPDGAAAVIDAGSTVRVEAERALLRGLRIVRPKGIGVWVKRGQVTLEGSRIEGTSLDDGGRYGHGLLVSDAGSIILQDSEVTGSAGVGVITRDAGAIILQNVIADNAGGGVRIERASGEARVERNTLHGNRELGVGVFSSRAIILQNTIADTWGDEGASADGIVVAGLGASAGEDFGPSDVTATDNLITGSDRVGILCSGALARGIILQHNKVEASGAENALAAAGLWLQAGAASGAGSLLDQNVVVGNRFVGIGLSGDTHAIILQNNAVDGTVLARKFQGASEVQIGDGINLFNGASAAMRANTVTRSGRFGLLIDDADAARTTIVGNAFNDNDQYGIILQNRRGPIDVSDNDTAGNAVGATLQDPPVPFATQDKEFAAGGG